MKWWLRLFFIACVISRLFSENARAAPTPIPIDDAINVQTYGAKGNGTTDDTAALNAAASAAAASLKATVTSGGATVFRNKELYFPAGIYVISGPIKFIAAAINVRSESGATIKQIASAPIFVFNNGNSGSFKIKVQGLQFLYGTNQISFSNNNLNATMLEVEDCSFYESTSYAIQAIGVSGDKHLSANLVIQNSKFYDTAGVLYNYADSAILKDSWVQVSSLTLRPNASVIFNGSGALKLDNVLTVPAIFSNRPRVPGVFWVQMTGGSLYVNNTRFGGEGAGYPIVRYDGNTTGTSGNLSVYPHMGPTISIENSMICAGGDQTPDAGVLTINKGLPHSIRIVNNNFLIGSPMIRVTSPSDAQNYIDSAPNTNVSGQLLNFVLGPNMARITDPLPAVLKPFVRN